MRVAHVSTVRLQQSLRRLCLDSDGKLNSDARRVAAWLRTQCDGDNVSGPPRGADGHIDTAQAMFDDGKRVVYRLLERALRLDVREAINQEPLK